VRGLSGKAAVVAGGAGLIGSATCFRLAEEGATVVVADIDGAAAASVAEQIVAAGGRASARTTDTSDEASVADLVDYAVKELGGLDLLHANAADLSPDVIGRDSDAVDVPLEVFDRTMQVNTRGYLLCARYAVPALLRQGGGALIFTSSAAAFAGERERPSYAMSKGAVNALVRHLASRWGKEGIRANAIAPGLVLSPAAQQAVPSAFLDHALALTRSARLGRPEDIAAMVAFLGSDDGEWINGQVIGVDGGAVLR
jgi:NAD(P)-dependent dehydrogenase (short-subunit alcohol dehydrogenase family)